MTISFRCPAGNRFCLGALALLAIALGTPSDVTRAADEPAQAAGQGMISGKIVDANGAPIAGAKIKLRRLLPEDPRWGQRWDVWHSQSDKAGEYSSRDLPDGYYLVSVQKTPFAQSFHGARIEGNQQQRVEIVLKPPVSPVIHVKDEEGTPVEGARVREFWQRGVNGECRFYQLTLKTLGIMIPRSDKEGRIVLPPLPEGDVVYHLTIDHPRLAPVRIDDLTVAAGAAVEVTMRPGVTLTWEAIGETPAERIASAYFDLRYDPFDRPSSNVFCEIDFDEQRVARLTVEPGNYSFLRLVHDDFYLTPGPETPINQNAIPIERGRNDDLRFELRRKVTARGRVVDADSGRPLAGMRVYGEIANRTTPGVVVPPLQQWSFAASAKTNDAGEYAMPVAVGRARVMFRKTGLVSESEYVDFTVAAGEPTIIPDIQVRPAVKITGAVHNPDGSPTARAVVRLRGKRLDGTPVLTDDKGRFELRPDWVPVDDETGKREFAQHIVAFDPYRSLAARAEVRLDNPQEVVLMLEPQEPDWPISTFSQPRPIAPEPDEKDTAISLRGRAPPELDGVFWLNTGGRPLKLADLRGKYVLLDFWFMGCGPCHAEFPSVSLVHELYKESGVVVVGVHTNDYTVAEDVREHVAKAGLAFPIVVDHPDGRMIARYKPHGFPDGYPHYVLIGPDGGVLADDRTIPHPSLRRHKLEIIRKYLLLAAP